MTSVGLSLPASTTSPIDGLGCLAVTSPSLFFPGYSGQSAAPPSWRTGYRLADQRRFMASAHLSSHCYWPSDSDSLTASQPAPVAPQQRRGYLRPLTNHSSRPCFARRLNSGVRAHAKRHSERIQSPYSGSVPRCCAWRHLARHRVLWWLRLARTGNVGGACNRVTVTCSVRTKSQPITSASLSFGYCCCMHVLPSPRPFRSLLPNPPWARRLLPSGGYGAALRAVLNGP